MCACLSYHDQVFEHPIVKIGKEEARPETRALIQGWTMVTCRIDDLRVVVLLVRACMHVRV